MRVFSRPFLPPRAQSTHLVLELNPDFEDLKSVESAGSHEEKSSQILPANIANPNPNLRHFKWLARQFKTEENFVPQFSLSLTDAELSGRRKIDKGRERESEDLIYEDSSRGLGMKEMGLSGENF